mmetsp:Transcript_37937/g.64812  ORF Transcript_37937/g.64812 Transcript_37937/m.64812 type:complete len:210 (-) Transcript_37937:70-699(-)
MSILSGGWVFEADGSSGMESGSSVRAFFVDCASSVGLRAPSFPSSLSFERFLSFFFFLFFFFFLSSLLSSLSSSLLSSTTSFFSAFSFPFPPSFITTISANDSAEGASYRSYNKSISSFVNGIPNASFLRNCWSRCFLVTLLPNSELLSNKLCACAAVVAVVVVAGGSLADLPAEFPFVLVVADALSAFVASSSSGGAAGFCSNVCSSN